MKIDAIDMPYKALNEKIRALAANGTDTIELDHICGQKFIGDGLKGHVKIDIKGIPGNDLAVFMDGPEITVHGNGQDGIGNTMNAGKVVIHGNAGDVIGYAMRGGEIFVKGDVGYRVGIHMKAYAENIPIIVIGGGASDFFGEYMAGGIMVVLGIGKDGQFLGDYLGSGMHGGVIYIRGDVDDHLLGRDVIKSKPGSAGQRHADEARPRILRAFRLQLRRGHEQAIHQADAKVAQAIRKPVRQVKSPFLFS